MDSTIARGSALLLIDYQQAFDDAAYWGPRNNHEAERNAIRILGASREARHPVFHIVHRSTDPRSPLRPGSPGHAVKPGLEPRDGEPVISKTVNSAFIGTDLETRLRNAGIGKLTVMGITTDHCVSTTVRMAANLGFEVTLVGDACATFARKDQGGVLIAAEDVHRVELAILGAEFAHIVTSEAVIASFADASAIP